MCGQVVAPAIAAFRRNLQPNVLRTLRANFPFWSDDQHICPECVTQVVDHARLEEQKRGTVGLQYELGLPFPVHSRDRAHILPTPLRMKAHPHFTGKGVTIAFLDSGFSPHPDLTHPTNRIKCYADATGARVVVKREFEEPTAVNWHGTMVASVGVGNGQMSQGVFCGIAPDAQVVAVKTGYRRGRISEADILRALTWVVDHHEKYDIKIVSISLGGDTSCDKTLTPLEEMIEEAADLGMTIVCASGNGGEEKVVPPASAPSAITVGGLDDQNALDTSLFGMYRSNWGTCGDIHKPDLIAPAIWIAAPMVLSTPTHQQSQFLWDLYESDDATLLDILTISYAKARFSKDIVLQPPDIIRRAIRGRMNEDKLIHRHYQHVDGTSMATPIVSSIVAQMLEANPKLSPKQIKKILLDTALPLEGVARKQQGHGVVNGSAAVSVAMRHSQLKHRKSHPLPMVGADALTFVFCHLSAQNVSIVGTLNQWQPNANPMTSMGNGIWQAVLPIPPVGEYRYKFLIDDKEWMFDPENPHMTEDGYGGWHSLLKI
jgi:serine protease AprX